MADEDVAKINGQVAQGFVPGGSKAAATTHSLANISFFYADADCIFSFNTLNVPLRCSKDAKNAPT